jgi:hypothetical protein
MNVGDSITADREYIVVAFASGDALRRDIVATREGTLYLLDSERITHVNGRRVMKQLSSAEFIRAGLGLKERPWYCDPEKCVTKDCAEFGNPDKCDRRKK